MDAGPLKRVLVFALAGALSSGMLAPGMVAARDAKRPCVIPGDADGPAGVQEAVVIQDRAGIGVIPLCVSPWAWAGGVVEIRVDSAGKVSWIGLAADGARFLEYSKR
jgi:hypothetical protein